MKQLTIVLVLFWTFQALATHMPYYPYEHHQKIKSMRIKNEEMKKLLKDVLQKAHLAHQDSAETLTGQCDENQENCYTQNVLNYRNARKFLFGKLHLKKDGQGYYIKDVYCNKVLTKKTRNIHNLGPMQIPNSNVVNCEHTWPQSRFTENHPRSHQVSDLHHLFPTNSVANSVRSNYRFSEVKGNNSNALCSPSHLGQYAELYKGDYRSSFFEPPTEHRGNVARALFYFSIRYDIKISYEEEVYLRKWNDEDPVDRDEIDRNNEIYRIQNNRNPFIDYPFLAHMISNF